MITRIVLSVVVAIVVGLLCILLGSILVALEAPPAVVVGGFLTQWGWVIGILAGLWYFFGGGTFPGFNRP